MYERDYKHKNRAKIRAKNLRYYTRHRKTCGQKANDQRKKKHIQAMTLLGGKCACCGETEFGFLTLDHVKNNGGGGCRRSRYADYHEVCKAFSSNNADSISRIKDKWQVLCWKCNLSKRHGVCRHNRGPIDYTTVKSHVRYTHNRVKKAKYLIGTKCVCCGEAEEEFLQIDHVLNDGNVTTKKNKHGKRYMYDAHFEILRAFRAKNPEAIALVRRRYQLLCASCNFSKYAGHGLCLHQRLACGTDGAYEKSQVMEEDRSHWADPSKHPDWPYAAAVPLSLCG